MRLNEMHVNEAAGFHTKILSRIYSVKFWKCRYISRINTAIPTPLKRKVGKRI